MSETDRRTRPAAAAGPGGALGGRKWLGLAIVSLAQLMVMLDVTVMSVALPSVQHGIGLTDADRQWVITAYTLAFGGLLLFGGNLADRLGRKRTFLIGVIGFAAASAVGGAAQFPAMIIGARAVQGAFAAVLSPSLMSLIATMFTQQRERTKAIGIASAIALGGTALGLPIGGLLTTYLDWRWCLYINLPIAVVAAVGALLVLPDLAGKQDTRFDLVGTVLACVGMVALTYGLSSAAEYGWGSGQVLVSMAVAVVGLAAFVLVERRVAHPMLPMRILTERNRAGAFLGMGLSRVGMFGVLLFLTYYLQEVMHYSALLTGFAAIPLVIANGVAATSLVQKLTPIVPPRWLVSPGLLLSAGAVFLFTFLTPDSSYVLGILPAEIILGIGLGLTNSPAMNTALSGTTPRDAGVTAATVSASGQIGASLGTALFNTIATMATASFIAASVTKTADVVQAGTVHGYVVASAWGAGILVAAAVLCALLINAAPKR
ncbi:DHA2 family efflux MFS transporter permease subunit [Kutzneria sp. NPDC052558]|uniref:DHA2 family efflux MFS transporter permease subunit n=1 Tax=Kutzneria sp. NPDC052558 TaxID=3364121 RepID=UPI0037C6C95B